MNSKQVKKEIEKMFKERIQILMGRNANYSNMSDFFSNFKRNAELLKTLKIDMTKPEDVALFFVIHKLDRIVNINKQNNPDIEVLEDSVKDLENYLEIYLLIKKEGVKR